MVFLVALEQPLALGVERNRKHDVNYFINPRIWLFWTIVQGGVFFRKHLMLVMLNMETKIKSTLQQWIPGIQNSATVASDYELLRQIACSCVDRIHHGSDEDLIWVQDVAKVTNLLYQGGNRYTKNAIENEFLCELVQEECPASLKQHMNLLPKELRKEYLKVILEN